MQTHYQTTLFQFLMVRLKVIPVYRQVWYYHISIPYGAIKRPLWKIQYLNLHTFQFLMVRLKDGWKVYIAIIIAYFNSLWCD